MKPIPPSLLIIFLTTWTVLTAMTHASSTGNIAEEIDSFVKTVLPCYSSPALSLAVVKDGRVILSKGYGYTSVEDNAQEVTSKTKFAIGSLTKAFTSLLLAKTVADKNLTMDTPIIEYIPSFKLSDEYRTSQTNLRDLLSHRTGLSDHFLPFVVGFDPQVTRDEFVRRLQWLDSSSSFRETFMYNNFMYSLAANILERLSDGQTWEDLVRASIFNPLNMTDSGFIDQVTNFSGYALPWELIDGRKVDLPLKLFKQVNLAGPAGSIYSTSDDMAKWITFLLSDDQQYKPHIETTRQPSMILQANSPAKPFFSFSDTEYGYGLAWFLGNFREYKYVAHSGSIVTYSSMLWLYPDINAGIFFSFNGPTTGTPEHPHRNLMSGMGYYISNLLLGLPSWFNASTLCDPITTDYHGHATTSSNKTTKPAIVESIDCSNLDLNPYEGNYTHRVFGDVSTFINSSLNQLQLSIGEFGNMYLTCQTKYVFKGEFCGTLSYMNPELNAIVFFYSDENDGIKSIALQNHEEFVGPYDRISMQKGNGQNHSPSYSYSWLSITICGVILMCLH